LAGFGDPGKVGAWCIVGFSTWRIRTALAVYALSCSLGTGLLRLAGSEKFRPAGLGLLLALACSLDCFASALDPCSLCWVLVPGRSWFTIWLAKLLNLMLGILGEGSDFKGHEGADVGVVGVPRRSSVEGGLDLEDFFEAEENSLVRLFFFFKGFVTGESPPEVTNGCPDPPPPGSIASSFSRNIDLNMSRSGYYLFQQTCSKPSLVYQE